MMEVSATQADFLEEYVEHLRDDDGIVPADEDKDMEEMPTYWG